MIIALSLPRMASLFSSEEHVHSLVCYPQPNKGFEKLNHVLHSLLRTETGRSMWLKLPFFIILWPHQLLVTVSFSKAFSGKKGPQWPLAGCLLSLCEQSSNCNNKVIFWAVRTWTKCTGYEEEDKAVTTINSQPWHFLLFLHLNFLQ